MTIRENNKDFKSKKSRSNIWFTTSWIFRIKKEVQMSMENHLLMDIYFFQYLMV